MNAQAKTSKPSPAQDTRVDRLAAALRENLKRRKAQSRAKERSKKSTAKD